MIANWSFQLRIFLGRISRVILNDYWESFWSAVMISFQKHTHEERFIYLVKYPVHTRENIILKDFEISLKDKHMYLYLSNIFDKWINYLRLGPEPVIEKYDINTNSVNFLIAVNDTC